MSKKNSKTANGGGTVSIPITGYTYTGGGMNQPMLTSATTTATASGTIHLAGLNFGMKPNQNHAIGFGQDGTLYSEDNNLFWENSKGEVFKLTFTKQETVKQIIKDL